MAQREVLKWKINNFKALDEAQTDLNCINYLTGPNSSGKSSYLQSLLLVAQSNNDYINLNGTLTRLGRGEDALKLGAKSIQITYSLPRKLTRGEDVIVTIEISPSKSASLANDIYISEFKVSRKSEGESDYSVIFEASDSRVGPGSRSEFKEYLNPSDSLLKVRKVNNAQINNTWIILEGFIPKYFLAKRNEKDVKKNVMSILKRKNRKEVDFPMTYLVSQILEKIHESNDDSPEQEISFILDPNPTEWSKSSKANIERSADYVTKKYVIENNLRFLAVPIVPSWGLGDKLSRIYPKYSDRHFLHTRLFLDSQDINLLDFLETSAVGLRDLMERISYIGPLREEPQVLSTSSGVKQNAPVGVKGELTADVLLRNRNREINYIDTQFNRKKTSFYNAVNDWVSYLGIGEKIETRDEGKLGRGVVLTLGDDKEERDLTQIGVGASQLLPIITLVLSSPVDSIVLLEQPELHLHPAVQSRLADFFLAQSALKGFVIETHSEYLITRSRLHKVAEKEGAELINFYFVENDDFGNHIFNKIGENKYGDLDFWPKGFFDTLENDSSEIVLRVRNKILGK